jgi:hypothetical protein
VEIRVLSRAPDTPNSFSRLLNGFWSKARLKPL